VSSWSSTSPLARAGSSTLAVFSTPRFALAGIIARTWLAASLTKRVATAALMTGCGAGAGAGAGVSAKRWRSSVTRVFALADSAISVWNDAGLATDASPTFAIVVAVLSELQLPIAANAPLNPSAPANHRHARVAIVDLPPMFRRTRTESRLSPS
jgi:hypothetical protein